MSHNTTAAPVKTGVIGAGLMGRNHLKTYNAMPSAELVGVYDVDIQAAQSAAALFGCKAYDSSAELAADCEALSVVTTSVHHAKAALPLLQAGKHCLIEKPLAANEEECNQLIAAADKSGAALLVGHIERFNPAVRKLGEIIEKGVVLQDLTARRMSKASGRITDVDVAMDLMIHDIEVIMSLVKSPVVSVRARNVTAGSTDGRDHVTAILGFDNGVMATVTGSRITPNRIRTLDASTEQGYFELDFVNQKLNVSQQGRSPLVGANVPLWAEYPVGVSTEKLFIPTAQPLTLELEHFIDCARGKTLPLISGTDALNALRVVWLIQEELGM